MVRIVRSIVTLFSVVAGVASAQVTYEWTEITPPGGQVRSVGTHPLDGRIIVLGTFNVHGDSVPVMYSSDQGRTWNATATALPYASSMFVHPGRPGVVFLGVEGFLGSVRFGTTSTRGVLYRSDDFGRTWSSVFTARDGESIQVVAADPLDAHAAYAFRKPGQACSAGFGCIYADDWQVAYTRNDGSDWTALSTLLRNRVTPYSNPSGPTPANPARLFVTALVSGQVLESRDRGATWSPLGASLQPPLDAVVPDPMRANVLYGHQHYIDQSDPFHVVNQNVTLRSEDGGASWREIFRSTSVPNPPIVDPLHTRTLWFGYPEYVNGSGFLLYRSDDSGDTWQTVPFPDSQFAVNISFYPQGLFPSTAEPGIVYVIHSYRLYRGVPSSVPDPVVVEYQYEGDRYWLTSLGGEALSQDYRQEPGDVHRTGLRWGAWRADDAPAGALGSCRFWPRAETRLRTRVLVLQGFECDILKRDPGWILEAENEFFALPPNASGGCATGQVPVRRFHNTKADVNHRWVADDAVAADMRARGWYDEGVRFCARPLGSNE